MSGHEQLAYGFQAMQELGLDDPRVHQAFQAAISSGDLEDGDTAVAYFQLGICWHGSGEQEKARDALEHALALGSDPKLLALVHHELGETYFVLEREHEAETHLRQSLSHDRQHVLAPDTLILLGRVVYVRTEHDANLSLVEECYGLYDEAVAMLESPQGAQYGDAFSRPKSLFDGYFGKAICKSDMPTNKERSEAVAYFERAEQLALEHPDLITRLELENTYRGWVDLLLKMGLERDAQLVLDRVGRHLN